MTYPIAKCGRPTSHGAHAYLETHGPRNGRRAWCAGNRREALVEARINHDINDGRHVATCDRCRDIVRAGFAR